MVTIGGKLLEATGNDLCTLANQECGFPGCTEAVLLLKEERILGASTMADYLMDDTGCIREQFVGISLD